MQALPRNEAELQSFLRDIDKNRQLGQFDEALDACRSLIDCQSTRVAGLRARADVYADTGQLELETADRSALVDLDSQEPSDYFELGACLWKSGKISQATEVYARGIGLGDKQNFHYYTNACRIHLSALLLKQGQYGAALVECQLLPPGYTSFLPVDGVTTKENLLERILPHAGSKR